LKTKRVLQRRKTSTPPAGAPNWCLSTEALRKFNRSTNNIPLYDYDTEEDDHRNNSENNENRESSENRENRENTRKRKKNSKQKKEKTTKNKISHNLLLRSSLR
jgi:hypothetical protein